MVALEYVIVEGLMCPLPPITSSCWKICVGSAFRTDPVIMKKIRQQQSWESSSQEETGGEGLRHLAGQLVQVQVVTEQLGALDGDRKAYTEPALPSGNKYSTWRH